MLNSFQCVDENYFKCSSISSCFGMSKRGTIFLIIGIIGGFLNFYVIFKCLFKIQNQFASRNHPHYEYNLEYNETISKKLFKEVRILCMILTHPENHDSQAITVKRTWGRRCNKIVFISTEEDKRIGSIAVDVEEGRTMLWDKTKKGLKYVYDHHFDEADWFMKADDDTYVLMENLRYMLYQYRSQTALYFGHRFTHGYMAGGAYVLSKKTLEKFITRQLTDPSACKQEGAGAEDWELGKCIATHSILVDERDDQKQKRFFPVSLLQHVQENKDLTYWYYTSQFYEVEQGSLNCCSALPIAFHYINCHEMYLVEYLTRKVHPFGIHSTIDLTLPRKLTFEEILSASDINSTAIQYQYRKVEHNFDKNEKFRRK
ncbi:CLUMA_CG013154, isoform A [Clunio marinus]|uniref:N-acetylgalactosaminide beta-1,3-galactosyltransferase n=1 Tax=Clunio marinus TaxID=568069 RepID=A0A1J1II13_9DIPT|nr:CLUMA_CG013154, isoform A [Clunio marinus]